MDEKMKATALASLNDEKNGAYMYDALTQVEKDPRLAEVYHRMAAVERKHADEWVERLKADGVAMPVFVPNWRSRTLAWAAKCLGVAAVLSTIMGNEQKDSQKYAQILGSAGMAADEASHNRLWKVGLWPSSKAGTALVEATPCGQRCWVPTMVWFQT